MISKGSSLRSCVQVTPEETHLVQLINNHSSLSPQLAIKYLLSISLLPKCSLCTSWQHWRSCLLPPFQLRALVANSVFVAPIVHAICQSFSILQDHLPASASASSHAACMLFQMAFSPEEGERRASPHPLPVLTALPNPPNTVL